MAPSGHRAPGRRRSWWGWGYEDAALPADRLEGLGAMLAARFGGDGPTAAEPVPLERLELPAPRIALPAALAGLGSTSVRDRALHSYGRSFRDVVRGFRGEFPHPPDVVAYPRTEADVVDLLDFCAGAGAAAIPYGGGSSVVGGVECTAALAFPGVVCIDLGGLDRVLEIDTASRAARIGAGALGPVLEDQLRPAGLSLRHFPQSFECSTLGGWIATRSGGHHATLATHIDDAVESLRVVTPRGVLESRRLPASGAGPSPDRLLIGSEGILGIITEAWMRCVERPVHRSSAAVSFPTFAAGAAAARSLAQSGLHPSNCRLLDATEALLAGAGNSAVLLVGFESATFPQAANLALALELCADHGGAGPADGGSSAGRDAGTDAWRRSFLELPYLRDGIVRLGAVAETFESAVTWDRWPDLHAEVTEAVKGALRAGGSRGALVGCRFTHVYADGAAPYWTVIAPGGADVLARWADVKAAASETLLRLGATITHHHAVGRDHRPWYDRQRPDLFADALVAAKRALDPAGILNPGVLIDAA